MLSRRFMMCLGAIALFSSACKGQDAAPAPASKDLGELKADMSKEPEVAKDQGQEPAPADELDVIKTKSGQIKVTALMHGSLMLSMGDKNLYIDPTMDALKFASSDKPESLPKADLILVTDIHGDHMDAEAIALLRKEGAAVIAPDAVITALGDKLPSPTLMANGQKLEVFDGALALEATPMYNLVRKREDNGEFFHVKGRGNGYILRYDEAAVYISGDTECTPEMKALTGIDAAFVTMNLPYTMPVEEAAQCAREFKPKALYPFHHRGQDVAQLKTLLADVPEVQVRLLSWYPPEAAK